MNEDDITLDNWENSADASYMLGYRTRVVSVSVVLKLLKLQKERERNLMYEKVRVVLHRLNTKPVECNCGLCFRHGDEILNILSPKCKNK